MTDKPDRIDMSALWYGVEPDPETRLLIQQIFGTAENKRLIADVALNAPNKPNAPDKKPKRD